MLLAEVLLALVVFVLLALGHIERRAHIAQVYELLQRIQAPEAAIVAHQLRAMPEDPAPLPFDDDEAFHATREELAERLTV